MLSHTPSNQEYEYQELQRQNRRRLINVMITSMFFVGLFAIIANNGPQDTQDNLTLVASEPSSSAVKPSIASTVDSTNNLTTESASQTSLNDLDLDIEAQRQQSEQRIINSAIPQTDSDIVTNTHSSPPPKPTLSKDERQQQARINAQKAEAERDAKRKMAIERAKQAKAQDEKNRKAQREQLLAQQKANIPNKPTLNNNPTSKTTPNPKPETLPATTTPAGKIVIQAGVFRDKKLALTAQQKIKALGYNVQVEEINTPKGKMIRIRAGGFNNRNAANQAAQKIRASGLDSMVIELK